MADKLDGTDEVTRRVDGTRRDTSDRPHGSHVGTIINQRFEVLDVIAEGGMGTVYRVRDHELDDVVALKMLRADVAAGAVALDLFRQEVKLARRVTHRNVARIYEIGEHEGRHYLTMEYIQGEPLSVTLRAQGRLSPHLAVYVLSAVCEALGAAHAVGVVHRDIKPSNVLVASDGRVVLTDFGLARTGYSGGTGQTVGTPAYMAPEQVQGGEVTPATDVYALGAMAYELITGRKPWHGASATDVAVARLEAPPPDPRAVVPSIPDELAAAIMRCMATLPEERFSSVMEASKAFMTTNPDTQVVPLAPSGYTARLTPKQPLVAVIPLEAGGDGVDVLLAGLVDDLIDALSAAKGLRVLSRAAVREVAKDAKSARDIGRALGARVVLEVSKRNVPDKVGVSVRLVQVADGVQLWAGRYAKDKATLLDISDAAAKEVSEVLSTTANPTPRGASADALVVDLYLRARHCYSRFSFDELGRAIDLFEQARARAPEDPLVCSGLAMALVRRWYWDVEGSSEWVIRARDAVETALQVAPWNGEPHLAHGTLLLHAGEPSRAARQLRHAIARNPSLGEAHEWLGRLLNEAGRVPEAVRRIECARMLDPCSSVPVWELIRNAALARRWDVFDRHMQDALGPSGKRRGRWTRHLRYATWRDDAQMLREIVDEFEQSKSPSRFDTAAVNAYIDVAVHGKRLTSVQHVLDDRAVAGGASARRAVYYMKMLAELAGLTSNASECIQALGRADTHGLLDLVWLEHCPLLQPVRDKAAFDVIRKNVQQRADKVYDALWS